MKFHNALFIIISIFVAHSLKAQRDNKFAIEANEHISLGSDCFIRCVYDSAIIHYNRALPLAKKAKDKTIEADIMRGMATVYYAQKKSKDALYYYLAALNLYEELGLEKNICFVYLGMSNLYANNMKNYVQAEKYANKAMPLAVELNDTACLAHLYNRFMKIRNYEGKWDECLDCAEKSRNYAFFAEDYPTMLCAMNTCAEILVLKKQNAKALEICKKALAISEDMNLEDYILESKVVLIAIYRALGQLSVAEQYAMDVMQSIDSNDYRMLDVYKELVQLYAQRGDIDNLLKYMELLINTLHIQNNNEKTSALAEVELDYATEKKEFQISTLEAEKHLIFWLGISLGSFLLLALVTFLLLWRWTLQKRRFSEQQVKQLQQEQQFIATQAVLDGEVQERIRIATDLHDGLGSLLTGVKLNLEALKEAIKLNDDVKHFNNAMNILNDSMLEMRRIAHHLMPDALSRFGLKAALKEFCDNFAIINFVWFGSTTRLHNRKKEVMIFRSIQELVNNALKHSGASQIEVNVMQEDDYIAFTVYDNGCGFNKTKQTEGMGLKNIYEKVAACNGRIEIDTKVGRGTEVNVELRNY